MAESTGAATEAEKSASAHGAGITEAEIVERIFEAVMERRLPAGTKLSESALCQAFGVGRMRIRRCLLVLASRQVVELHSNRGAYVASPTAEQACDVFEARQAIEPAIARLAAERATEADLAGLEALTKEEAVAQDRGSRHDAIRLSGKFHVHLAQAAGNATLARLIEDLVTRSSLILGIYGSPGLSTCRDHDHRTIIGALRTRDRDSAARIMTEHLLDISATMDLTEPPAPGADLVQILTPR